MFGTETSRWLLSSDPGTGLIIALYVNVPAPATPMTWVCTSLRIRHNKTASARIKVSSQLNNDVNIISSIRRENILILVLALNDMLASLTCIKAYKSWFFVSFLFLLMSWFVSWRLGEDRRSQMLFFFYFSIFWNRHLFEEPKHVGAGRAYKNGRWIWSEAHRWVFNLQTGVIMRVRSWIAGKSGK